MTAARKLVDPYQEYTEVVAPVSRQQPRTKAKAKRRTLPATVKICLVAACCVVVSLLYLQQQVTAYYLNMELVQLQEQANKMEQRNDHLMLNLESQRSLQQIELIARTTLGMVEPEYTATIVVPNHTVDLAGDVEGRWFGHAQEESTFGGFFETLASLVNKVLPLGGVEAGTLRR
ncbi:MAG: hypothetical protein GX971_01060 [Firmicutes bacterium]|nr:hypothetical protein [Bacillota bacterium]